MNCFDPQESLGLKSLDEIESYLRAVGDHEAADRFRMQGAAGQGFGRFFGAEYSYTGFVIGFIPPSNLTNDRSVIIGLNDIAADISLRGQKIKVTLDKLYVQKYPGLGQHRVLCEFAGKNQAADDTEEMRFALTVDAYDKGSASINGKPIFMGVTVGDNGIAFEGRTVNVRSRDDDLVLNALENDAFKQGLSLIGTVQPALKPFASLAAGVVTAAAKRSKNCQVHAFSLGLDFSHNITSARLRCGSYIVVQVDANQWDWSKFAWNQDGLSIMSRSTGEPLGLNYMIIGVSPFEGAPVTAVRSSSSKALKSPK
jgi:hypothetical protein